MNQLADIFPFFGDIAVASSDELPLYTEIAWDFNKNSPIIENGEFKKVTGNEAIKAWAFRSLQTDRYKYAVYSWDYGEELMNLIGQNYSKALINSEGIRHIEECLLINPYIESISNVTIEFINGLLTIECSIDTIYGTVELEEVVIGV